MIIAWVLAAVAMLKGLRMPSRWAVTHLTFNYSQGFVRRGLVGEILRHLLGNATITYLSLAVVSGVLFVCTVAVLAIAVRRAMATDLGDRGLQSAVCVLLASPALVFLMHLIGYLDCIGLTASLVFILWASSPRAGYRIFYIGALLGVVMALVHEALVIIFGPVLLFAMLCVVFAQEQALVQEARVDERRKRRYWYGIAHVVGATLITYSAMAVVAKVGTRSPAVVSALLASVRRHAAFPLREDAFAVLCRPIEETVLRYMPAVRRSSETVPDLVHGFVAALPAQLFLIFYAVRLIGRLGLAVARRRALLATLLGAYISPLMLNLVGTDATRWAEDCTLAIFTCILALRLVVSARAPDPTAHRIRSPWLTTLAACAVIVSLCTGYKYFLFDGYSVEWFPFTGRIDSALDLWRHRSTFIPPA